jgi:hypothetical protein
MQIAEEYLAISDQHIGLNLTIKTTEDDPNNEIGDILFDELIEQLLLC